MRIPTATYRLQFNHQFGFRDAESILDYLHQLGVSDIYASPVFCANPQSMHGYDMTDPTSLNPELGTEADFQRLLENVQKKQMGWLQDFVPNHMAYSHHNRWLMDVLEYSPLSPYYTFFDINWDHPDPALHGKVLAPFLGAPLEKVIENKQLRLHYGRKGFAIDYYDRLFPVNLYSLTETVQDMNEKTLILFLPAFEDSSNRDETEQRKTELYNQSKQNPGVRAVVEALIEYVHSNTAVFKQLMSKQYYHLAYWKTAGKKINYRRFFYINDLICLNIERPEVFQAVHSAVGNWIRNGLITGLRIDHLDGLRYPGRYLKDLRQVFGDLYVVAEKILEKDESVPTRWPLQGTTGYDFGNYTTAVFCQHRHRDVFIEQYEKFSGRKFNYEQLLYEQKKKVISQHMQGDIDNLVRLLLHTSVFRDQQVDTKKVSEALLNLISAFGVYRTYISDHAPGHREYLSAAVSQAQLQVPERVQLLEQIQELFLSFKNTDEDLDFITRFRQLTGPAMAKGFEDTLLYLYHPLVSLNEVGSMPEVFGISVQQFHKFNAARVQTPHTMNTTSTHDTKRGEDIRARVNVLSEMPAQWFEKVTAWRRINQQYKTTIDGEPAPDCNDEYMLYQILLGALPVDSTDTNDFCERLKKYVVKTIREAKVHGNWIEPNEAYEQAAVGFVEKLFQRPQNDTFWNDFQDFWHPIHKYGLIGSLSQTLMKMACPGIPDFYQGTECWDLNLVDPDNRRPVDYSKPARLLKQLDEQHPKNRAEFLEWLISQRDTGIMKLFIIRKTLHLRKQQAALFADGEYTPLETEGTHNDHIIAFARIRNKKHALVFVPRLVSGISEPGQMPLGKNVWKDTRVLIPEPLHGQNINIFTGEQINLKNEVFIAEIFNWFPVSLICDFA